MSLEEFKKITKVWKETLERYNEDKSLLTFNQISLKKGVDYVLAVHKDFLIVFNTKTGLECIKDTKTYKFDVDEDAMRKALRLGLNLKPTQTNIFDFLGA